MSYKREFIDKVRNREYLPNFEKPGFLPELEKAAGDAMLHRNIYGYLSAVLIYHQMKEEILKALFKKAQFYIRMYLFPEEAVFSEENYSMLDYVVNDTYVAPDFKKRHEILELSKELDCVKERAVYALSLRSGVNEIENMAVKARGLSEEIFTAFSDSNLWFYSRFREYEQSSLRNWLENFI